MHAKFPRSSVWYQLPYVQPRLRHRDTEQQQQLQGHARPTFKRLEDKGQFDGEHVDKFKYLSSMFIT